MICTGCGSPYTAPYNTLLPSTSPLGTPTSAPCPTPSAEVAYAPMPPTVQVPPSGPQPSPALYAYRNTNHLPVESIYGDQGPNGNIVCGTRPLTSVREVPMWNEPPKCAPTQSQTAQNVSDYDFYQSALSVLNPYTGRPLPTVTAMWHPQNIALIKGTIECMLSKEFGFAIGIEDTPAFRQTISDVLVENPRWMYDVQVGLPLLNEVVVKREFTVHQSAIRQQLLYEKYIIRNDRQKFMPYAVSDHVVKGETINDPSSYTLNQPVPISYDCFLTQANLWCKK